MKSTLKLFKAVPIKTKKTKKLTEVILKKTIKHGFILSEEVVGNYQEHELSQIISDAKQEFGLSAKQANSAFHKSWEIIKKASLEALIFEQIMHYITTYGFKDMGIYNESTVYIPKEKLDLPEIDVDKILLIKIKGYTDVELKKKLAKLLESGVALKEDTIKAVVDVATYLEFDDKEIEAIKNKEVKVLLYDYLGKVPENPVEFLRFCVYKATDKTLLIKNKTIIEEIKEKKNIDVLGLFVKYKNKYGLNKLAEIFYRFKPLFLAFRTGRKLKTMINKIRKLAVKYHKPMPEDYLNSLTANLVDGVNVVKLTNELNKVNVFRKIRLAYALAYRTNDVESILYKIRNGKGYAKEFNFDYPKEAQLALTCVMGSIIKDIKKNVNGKKIYIPDNIVYALPATEKQFTDNFP